MAYQWEEYSENYNGVANERYSIRIDYDDGTPCYEYLKGEIKYRNGLWSGEIGGTNQMAEYLSNGWDSFFRFEDNDLDVVFEEMDAYIDELVDGGNVPQEWVYEKYVD